MKERKRIIRGSLLSVARFAIHAGLAIALMPVLLEGLGNRGYGLWVLAATLIGYFQLLDLGLPAAVSRYVSRSLFREETDFARSAIATCFYLLLAIGVASFFILAAVHGYFANALPGSQRAVFELVLWLLAFGFFLGLPFRALEGAMNGLLRQDIVASIQLISALINAIGVIAILRAGHGIVGLAVMQLATSLMNGAALIYFVIRYEGREAFAFSRINFRLVAGFGRYAWGALLSQAADIVRFRLDVWIIAVWMDASRVALYAVASRLIEFFIQLVTSATSVLVPLFSRFEKEGQAALQENFLLATKISSAISVLIGGMTLVMGRALIERWLGPGYDASYQILAVLLVPMTIALMQAPSVSLLYGISKHSTYGVASLIEGAVNFCLSLWLVERYGMMGIAIGTAVPMTIMKLFVQPVYVCRLAGISYSAYMKTFLSSLIVCSAPFAVVWALGPAWSASARSIAGQGGLHLVVYAAIVSIVLFTKQERTSLYLYRRARS